MSVAAYVIQHDARPNAVFRHPLKIERRWGRTASIGCSPQVIRSLSSVCGGARQLARRPGRTGLLSAMSRQTAWQ